MIDDESKLKFQLERLEQQRRDAKAGLIESLEGSVRFTRRFALGWSFWAGLLIGASWTIPTFSFTFNAAWAAAWAMRALYNNREYEASLRRARNL